MAGILSFLRAAIQPAAAARTGYLQGQEQGRERKRTLEMQDAALRRQGLLDQIKASVDQSTITRNNAQADRARRPPTPPREDYDELTADDGTVYFRNRHDPNDVRQALDDNGKPIKGRVPPTPRDPTADHRTNRLFDIANPLPVRPGSTNTNAANAQERLDAKTALDEALKAVPRPSTVKPDEVIGKNAQGKPDFVPNPERTRVAADSTKYEAEVLGPLRKHLLDVTVGAKVPLGGQPDGSAGASKPTPPRLNRAQSAAMQAEFNAASADLKTILNSNAPKAVKDQARALYDEQQKQIAKKYNATTTPDDDHEEL